MNCTCHLEESVRASLKCLTSIANYSRNGKSVFLCNASKNSLLLQTRCDLNINWMLLVRQHARARAASPSIPSHAGTCFTVTDQQHACQTCSARRSTCSLLLFLPAHFPLLFAGSLLSALPRDGDPDVMTVGWTIHCRSGVLEIAVTVGTNAPGDSASTHEPCDDATEIYLTAP